ncbi:MAG: Panacea domain-containing protein [Opitutaceae bacterium]
MVHGAKLSELIVYLGAHPKVTNLGLTKLWKLIFFVDAKSVRDLGAPLTGSEFIKYAHGPVPSRGEKQLRQLVRDGDVTTTPRAIGGKTLNEVKAARAADLSVFSPEEKDLVDGVCAELGRKSAAALSDLSHQEPAWHYAEMMGKLSPELIAYGVKEDADGL